jgi:mannose-6-phosphate isomerase-like protein (cupin superfamily)
MADEKLQDQAVQATEGEEEEVRWERWQKKRIFVRELSGKYEEIYKDLYAQPRVIKTRDVPYKGGPILFGNKTVNPANQRIIQAFESHIDTFAPGGYGQRHYHINSAVFYILNGRGHDVHNGYSYPWKAGDAAIVENSCVHQHFNDDPDNYATILVIKPKPTFGFNHLMIQKNIVYPPIEPRPGYEDFRPPEKGEYAPLSL